MQTPPTIARIDAQAGLQRRVWLASRIAWWAMGAALLLAAGGAFGDGPLAEAEAASGDGSVTVRYDRFQRSDAGSPLLIRLAPRPGAAGEARFCLDHAFSRAWQVTEIEPAALREELEAGGTCHVVPLAAAAPAAPVIGIRVHPRRAALRAEGAVYLPGGGAARVAALVWP
ncbi:hypothetical protein EAH89_01265 [Roseomonas nepalensis]|uniref:Uncharacterized protein n=1 Tax=Muricoccus nepalensis TaxID=1854500 RepID=A0A502GFY3_9PROT|nr:hypothetical protein [Roseomonas nepalensis]TPG61217.1 hypothetical protein EAH89_01265 [Roseomonas nepalensis]